MLYEAPSAISRPPLNVQPTGNAVATLEQSVSIDADLLMAAGRWQIVAGC